MNSYRRVVWARRTSGAKPFFGTQSAIKIDCNTVGPVPTASGYGSKTLIRSVEHVPDSSTDNASANPTSKNEISPIIVRIPHGFYQFY